MRQTDDDQDTIDTWVHAHADVLDAMQRVSREQSVSALEILRHAWEREGAARQAMDGVVHAILRDSPVGNYRATHMNDGLWSAEIELDGGAWKRIGISMTESDALAHAKTRAIRRAAAASE